MRSERRICEIVKKRKVEKKPTHDNSGESKDLNNILGRKTKDRRAIKNKHTVIRTEDTAMKK